MTLETLQTFDQNDVKTKRQKDKKTKRQKVKKTKRKKEKKTKRQKDRKTERQKTRPKKEFNIVTSGQFRTLAMFLIMAPLSLYQLTLPK